MARVAFVFLVLLLAGCDDNSRSDSRTLDVEDPEFRQGQSFHKQGETRKALECYLKVIDKRKDAAESHLEAGRMYLELQDPLPAIYHFNQFIRMKPASDQASMVRGMVRTAEKQFMQQLPGRPMEPDAIGSVDVTTQLRRLQAENDKLKREITDLSRNQRPSETKTVAGPAAVNAVPDPHASQATKTGRFRPYTIAKGDSLSTISRKMFNDGNHVQAIFNANRDKMTSPDSLPKIGTVILIPE